MTLIGLNNGRSMESLKSGSFDSVTCIFKIQIYELSKLFSFDHPVEERLQEIQDKHKGMDGLLEKLQTERQSGIMGDQKDLMRRQSYFGRNIKPAPQLPKFGESLLDAFKDWILFSLAICAVLSMIFGMVYDPKTGWAEGVCIFIVLGFMILITSLNDWIKDRRFVELQAHTKDQEIPVFRGKKSQMQTVDMWELVVGDIVLLSPGDIVPADCIIIRSDRVTVINPNELEQNSTPQHKNETDPFLFADQQIVNGNCTAVVAAVGTNSTRSFEVNKLDTSETDLQQKLFTLTKTFTFIALISAIVIFILALIIQCIQTGVNEEIGGKTFMKKLTQNVTLCIVILMVCIPEGLPMAVSISLAHSTQRMYSFDKILVCNLEAPEKLGQITEICTGLTGTMTQTDFTVRKFYAQKKMIKNSRPDTIKNCELQDNVSTIFQESVLWNTDCHMELNDDAFYVPVGNETECAYLRWLQDAEVDVHYHCQSRLERELARIPFNSNNKRSIVAVQHPNMADTVRIFVKGASEVVMPNCTEEFDSNGDKMPFDEGEKERMLRQVSKKMSKKGLRVLAFSYKDMSSDEFEGMRQQTNDFDSPGCDELLAQGQTFVAFIALNQKLREGVRKACKKAKRAGVQIRIVTNNSLQTAVCQAVQAGLLPKDYADDNVEHPVVQAMEAKELSEKCGGIKEEMNDNMELEYHPVDQMAFEQLIENLVVIARASPSDKLLLSAGLKAMGKRVAVIGDGNNDVKSFSNAHVSMCMGTGTALAKQRCDIVLTDSEFIDCINAMMYGRNIYTNIKRFLQFQVTINFSLLITIFLGICYLTESPLNSTQLLWINLIMDTFAALALSTMPPFASVLDEPAVVSDTQVMTKTVWRQIYGITIWNTIVMSIIIFAGKGLFGLDYTNATQTTERVDGKITPEAIAKRTHFTIIFNIFVQLCWFNEWNCRVVGPKEYNFLKRPFSSWTFLIIMIGTAVFQWSACTWLWWLFETEELDFQLFFRCVLWGASVIPAAIVLKLTPESWVEKMPVGIKEDKALGQGSFIMRGYDKMQDNRKMSGAMLAKRDQIQPEDDDQETAQPEENAVDVGDADDQFKRQE